MLLSSLTLPIRAGSLAHTPAFYPRTSKLAEHCSNNRCQFGRSLCHSDAGMSLIPNVLRAGERQILTAYT